MHWILTIPGDFLLSDVIKKSQMFLLPPSEFNEEHLERVEHLASGNTVAVTIFQVPAGLHLEVQERLTGAETEEISQKTWRMLRLGENFAPFLEFAQKNDDLSQAIQNGTRILRGATFYEDISKAILLSRFPGEKQRIAKLVDHLGAALPSNPTRHAYPTLTQVLHNPAALNELLGPEFGLTFLACTKYIHTHQIALEKLVQSQISTEKIKIKLLEIPGMNDTALALSMLAIGRYTYLPVDRCAQARVSRVWYNKNTITPKAVHDIFSRWHPWEGLVYWLWDWPEEICHTPQGKERALIHGNASTEHRTS